MAGTDVDLFKMCNLCQNITNTQIDTLRFGKWVKIGKITVHYLCLLFSTNLMQSDKKDNGIMGFTLADINLEIKNASNRRCSYCDKFRASVCCVKCKKYFHFVCGEKHNAFYNFKDDYQACCSRCLPPKLYPKELEDTASDGILMMKEYVKRHLDGDDISKPAKKPKLSCVK